MNATGVVIGPCLFSLFCSTWREVLKTFVRFSFGLKQVKSREKSSTGAIYRTEKWRNGDKRALDYFRMPKLQENRYERLAVPQNVFAIILL